MKSRWRASLFFGLAVVATLLGIVFRGWASTPRLSDVTAAPPFTLDVYVPDPRQAVDVTLDVFRVDPSGQLRAVLEIGGNAAGVLITSTQPDSPSRGHHAFVKTRPDAVNPALYAFVVPPGGPRSTQTRPLGIAEFDLPTGSVSLDRGTYAARLPALGLYERGEQFAPAYGVLNPSSSDQRLFAVSMSRPFSPSPSTDPADYDLPFPHEQHLYWQPAGMTSRVRLEGEAEQVTDSRLDTDVPATGGVVGNDLVWTGGFGLSPFISATHWDAVEARSRWDFYSGVALGLGAAAVLALFQELPERLALRLPGRRSPSPTDDLDGETGVDVRGPIAAAGDKPAQGRGGGAPADRPA